jgi:hypothetical protein
MARWIGWPVSRSQTTQVSRWFVIPMAAISWAGARALDGERQVPAVVDQRSAASCSTQPERG